MGRWRCETRAGQWLGTLGALAGLATLWTLGGVPALGAGAALLAILAVADRRPAGTPFLPAQDALGLLARIGGWLLRLLAAPPPSRRRAPLSPRR